MLTHVLADACARLHTHYGTYTHNWHNGFARFARALTAAARQARFAHAQQASYRHGARGGARTASMRRDSEVGDTATRSKQATRRLGDSASL